MKESKDPSTLKDCDPIGHYDPEVDESALSGSSSLLDGSGLSGSSSLLDDSRLSGSSSLLDGSGLSGSSSLLDDSRLSRSSSLLDGSGLSGPSSLLDGSASQSLFGGSARSGTQPVLVGLARSQDQDSSEEPKPCPAAVARSGTQPVLVGLASSWSQSVDNQDQDSSEEPKPCPAAVDENLPKNKPQIYQKFQKGACTNCGDLTHNNKDCMERPRKTGAKYKSKLLIVSPEKIKKECEEDYAAKRDQWKNYDSARMHSEVVARWEEKEKARKTFLGRRLVTANNNESDRAFEQSLQLPVPPASYRNREDTPKYLLNVDPNSSTDLNANFFSEGDKIKKDPFGYKSYKTFRENLKKEVGREEDDFGIVIPKSKYEEDVMIKNHTSVWGSYWEDHKWGYMCCKQTVKDSYCTGDKTKNLTHNLKKDVERDESD